MSITTLRWRTRLKFNLFGWPELWMIKGEFGSWWNMDAANLAYKQSLKRTWEEEPPRLMTREEIIKYW